MSRHVVAAVGEIAEGERKLVNVEGREIGVFNVKGEFYALLNRCPHAGASLCRGTVIGLAESDRPGEYRSDAGPASSCAARGTAGSSTSAPGNPGSIRSMCARAPTRRRSSRARS